MPHKQRTHIHSGLLLQALPTPLTLKVHLIGFFLNSLAVTHAGRAGACLKASKIVNSSLTSAALKYSS